jgi:hypothetical protein
VSVKLRAEAAGSSTMSPTSPPSLCRRRKKSPCVRKKCEAARVRAMPSESINMARKRSFDAVVRV